MCPIVSLVTYLQIAVFVSNSLQKNYHQINWIIYCVNTQKTLIWLYRVWMRPELDCTNCMDVHVHSFCFCCLFPKMQIVGVEYTRSVSTCGALKVFHSNGFSKNSNHSGFKYSEQNANKSNAGNKVHYLGVCMQHTCL